MNINIKRASLVVSGSFLFLASSMSIAEQVGQAADHNMICKTKVEYNGKPQLKKRKISNVCVEHYISEYPERVSITDDSNNQDRVAVIKNLNNKKRVMR